VCLLFNHYKVWVRLWQVLIWTRMKENEISEKNKIIIFEENSDREKLLEIFISQYINKKNIAPQYRPLIKEKIKEIVAKIQRELSSPGEWVQNPSGEWTEKE